MVNCPFCKAETKVLDKRSAENATRRRRECLKCEKRFTTYERPEINIMVLKKDGRREPFSRGKLVAGLRKACEKRPVELDKIDETADLIENDLRRHGDDVKSHDIGELVMKYLKRLDKVAYIRFASVYRSFDDIAMFEKEIRMLKTKK